MKKLMLILFVVASASFIYAQKVNDPMIVKNELKNRYPNAENIMWDIGPGSYKATFEENGSLYVVDFDEKGVVHSVTTRLSEEEVPEDINAYMLKQYPGEKYKEINKITERDGKVSYSMKMKNNKYHFDQNFKFLYTEDAK